MPTHPPKEAAYIWAWFEEICGGLEITSAGMPVISWTALRAWREETAMPPLTQFESRMLMQWSILRAAVHAEWLAASMKKHRHKDK